MINYADDTTPFVCDSSSENVTELIEKDDNLFFDWFLDNYFKANPDKSHFLINECKELL